MSLSSRGLGHHPFTVSTGVRIPLGTPIVLPAVAQGEQVGLYPINLDKVQDGVRFLTAGPLTVYKYSVIIVLCPGDGIGIRVGLRSQILRVRVSPWAPYIKD